MSTRRKVYWWFWFVASGRFLATFLKVQGPDADKDGLPDWAMRAARARNRLGIRRPHLRGLQRNRRGADPAGAAPSAN